MPGASPVRYVHSGDVNIAYQVVGDGPVDLLLALGWVSNLEVLWEQPAQRRFLERLASFSRLILFDKRGVGLSDRVAVSALPTLEMRMDDVRAVMDAAGSQRAALMGVSEGGPMCMLFAATYPERASHLVIYGSYARRLRSDDYPHGPTPDQREAVYSAVEKAWGGPVDLSELAPSVADDPAIVAWWARYLRASASPGAAVALLKMNSQVDVRAALSAVTTPTLVLHRTGDRDITVGNGRYIAERIPGARFVELPGEDHLWWVGDTERILGEVQEFITGERPAPEVDRVLATVLFTDVVGSTALAERLGDAAWRDRLEVHSRRVREELETYRGREIDNAGDGFLSAFDGPARAVRAALAIAGGTVADGLEVRAGVHTGECMLDRDGRLRGIAVHVGARVASLAAPGEVVVSQTVKDLVAGSGLGFEDRGEHELKGVSGRWRVYRATAGR